MDLLPLGTRVVLGVTFGFTALSILLTLPYFLKPEQIKKSEDYKTEQFISEI